MTKNIRASLLFSALSILICCVAYPLALRAAAWTLYRDKAEGSLIQVKGADGMMRVVGSKQIAQPFTAEEYFWPRPSAAGSGYNAAAASGSNYGANNPKLRDRVAQQLGTIIKYKSGSASAESGLEPRTPQQDIEAWFAAKLDRLADWANEYSVGVSAWAKTDFANDKYGLQGEFILAWEKDHPEIIDEWKKANPTKTDDPKPEDLAANFFTSYASANLGKWPGVVEVEMPDKTKEKKIAPVTSDSAISANLFDMWLQDPANASKVADLEPVPADMVTASGAGLDPHITMRNALSVYQLDRVATKRTPTGGDAEKTKQSIAELVRKQSFTPLSGLAGEPLVNVLELNVELDAKWPVPAPAPVAVANPPEQPNHKDIVIAPSLPPKDTVDVAARIKHAKSLAERGDEGAIDELKKLIEAAPKSAEAQSELGQAYLRFGRFRPAAAAFREAAARFPANSEHQIAAETAARDALRWAGLERRLPEMLVGAATPSSPAAWADFGEICRYTGRYAAACRFFTKAAGGDSKYARVAAICATLAGFNRGKDSKDLTDEKRSELRRTALMSLRTHREWATDLALVQLKDSIVIDNLPAGEQPAWRSLWSSQD